MGRRRRLSASPEVAGAVPGQFPSDLQWPFGLLDTPLSRDELRESAYEIFFASCRSPTGAGVATRYAVDYHREAGVRTPRVREGLGIGSPRVRGDHLHREGGSASPRGSRTPWRSEVGAKNMAVTSRLKRELGLRARKARPMAGAGKARPMTSAEIMRRQMGVAEQTDGRVRKTLARCLVGPQMPKKMESLVLPMELLRHLKSSEFADADEHHSWQLRQLKVLDAGLVSHPAVPLDRPSSNSAASSLRETLRSTELETRPLDTRALSSDVLALAWRSVDDVCHWADGYPLNVHLYLSLLRAVFDHREETTVLDEVDELLELIKKTWTTLGLNRMIHNVCFTWLLFERYLVTGQIEPDLLSATLAMLQQVSDEAKKADREPGFIRVLSATLSSMYSWAEHELLDYREAFEDMGAMSTMENVLALAVSAAKTLSQHVPSRSSFAAADLVERYIKSSVRHSFNKLHESSNNAGLMSSIDSMVVEVEEDPSHSLMYVARATRDMTRDKAEVYGPMMKRWHPCPAAVVAATLHGCFGAYLKRHVSKMDTLSSETMHALQAASDMDKYLVKMAVDGGADEGILKQMTSYDVDSIIFGLVRNWMDERLRIGAECVKRARDSESWNPRSKSEPYAQSAVDLMKLAKVTVDELLDMQPACRDGDLLQHLVDGVDRLVHQYASFVASSAGKGTKESYMPPLPQLTRCNQDSKLVQLWKKAAPPCQVGLDDDQPMLGCGGGSPVAANKAPRQVAAPRVRPTTSRSTQRLYVRLNTLHYLLAALHTLERSLAPRGNAVGRRRARAASFDRARAALAAAVLHVAELSAYRLVFLDSAHEFHQALYQGSVGGARIRPALRAMKQNLAFLAGVVIDRAQPAAVRQVLKASVEAFLLVLLAGGSGRSFTRADYGAVAEDFASLKRLFCSCGEGLVAEEVVEREAAAAEEVVALMALSTEKLIDEFTSRSTGSRPMSPEYSVPMAMPPTTKRWSRSDANTILRVLCHRDDEVASRFLKKTFDLPKRR